MVVLNIGLHAIGNLVGEGEKALISIDCVQSVILETPHALFGGRIHRGAVWGYDSHAFLPCAVISGLAFDATYRGDGGVFETIRNQLLRFTAIDQLEVVEILLAINAHVLFLLGIGDAVGNVFVGLAGILFQIKLVHAFNADLVGLSILRAVGDLSLHAGAIGEEITGIAFRAAGVVGGIDIGLSLAIGGIGETLYLVQRQGVAGYALIAFIDAGIKLRTIRDVLRNVSLGANSVIQVVLLVAFGADRSGLGSIIFRAKLYWMHGLAGLFILQKEPLNALGTGID